MQGPGGQGTAVVASRGGNGKTSEDEQVYVEMPTIEEGHETEVEAENEALSKRASVGDGERAPTRLPQGVSGGASGLHFSPGVQSTEETHHNSGNHDTREEADHV